MKKLALTIAIVLGMGIGAFAGNEGGGLFQRGEMAEETNTANGSRDVLLPVLPNHGLTSNQNAPLGSGLVLLAGLGAAYLVGKKRKEE